MNGYLRAMLTIPNGYLRLGIKKIFHFKELTFGCLPRISFNTEITLERGGCLHIGKRFNMRGSSRIRTNKDAKLSLGDNVSLANGCMIVCHDKIIIGNDVQLSPYVLIYDHDHDYRCEGGVKSGNYLTSPVKIGNNVWIGANTIVLRGSTIGDNVVIGAGSVVSGTIDDNSVFIQKRINNIYRME